MMIIGLFALPKVQILFRTINTDCFIGYKTSALSITILPYLAEIKHFNRNEKTDKCPQCETFVGFCGKSYSSGLIDRVNHWDIADPIFGVCVSIDPPDIELVFCDMLTIIDFLPVD